MSLSNVLKYIRNISLKCKIVLERKWLINLNRHDSFCLNYVFETSAFKKEKNNFPSSQMSHVTKCHLIFLCYWKLDTFLYFSSFTHSYIEENEAGNRYFENSVKGKSTYSN